MVKKLRNKIHLQPQDFECSLNEDRSKLCKVCLSLYVGGRRYHPHTLLRLYPPIQGEYLLNATHKI